MGLFSGFTKPLIKRDLSEELKAIRLEPTAFGTKVFHSYVNAVANKDYKVKDPIKWIKHTDRSERSGLCADLEDGVYKIIGIVETKKLGVFYEILPEDLEDQEGVWVSKDDIWELDS